MIERRRAPEFAAMAAAGEDDDDEDDETDRRASTKPGKQGGPPGPGTSLKGKESFKSRQPTRNDYERSKRRKRTTSERRGFIEGLTSQASSEEDDDKPDVGHGRTRHASVSPPHISHGLADIQDNVSMQYAMNLHQTPNYPPQSSARLQYPNQAYRDQPLQPSYSNYGQSSYPPQAQSNPYPNAYPPTSQPPANNNFMPNNMQWDPDMLSRYAEYQLQQNHQRQQRILLERQRHQLAELGIPVDDSGLLDQLFAGGQGAGVVPTPQQASSSNSHNHSSGTPQDDLDQGGFAWPTAGRNTSSQRPAASGLSPQNGNGMLDHLYGMGREAVKEGDDTGFTWPTAGGGDGYMPSPESAEELKRANSFGNGGDDKRARLY
jgi:MADS-box transcription factor